ncbi:MAG: preprotein translocase subunit YajC [Nitrospirota bacterium]
MRTVWVRRGDVLVGVGLAGSLMSASVAGAQESAGPGGPLGPLSGFIPFLLIIVLFYVLLIMPQQRRQKKHRAMLEALKKDDKVVTNGGIYGVVKSLSKDTVTLEVGKGVGLKIRRDAIAELRSGDDEETK